MMMYDLSTGWQAAAVFGWVAAAALWQRNRSERDQWYAIYLVTFTFTQLVDAALWTDGGFGDAHTCSTFNWAVSKFFVPMVIFSQHLVQCLYPSKHLDGFRWHLIAAHLLPVAALLYQFSCSTLIESFSGPTICWGGVSAETYQILIHSGIVAFIFWLLMPARVAFAHIATLASVIALLYTTEGTLALGSKWCSYCLVYSFVYLLEPLWMPETIRPKSTFKAA